MATLHMGSNKKINSHEVSRGCLVCEATCQETGVVFGLSSAILSAKLRLLVGV